ncbi:MAG: anti-sigma factor family protein [Candidatus Aminicenantales bacterium]
MGCKKFEKLIIQSLDRELKHEQRAKLEAHLQRCPSCQNKRKEYLAIHDILKEEKEIEPKAYFWPRLQAKIKTKEQASFWPFVRQWSIRIISASIIFALLLAFIIAFFTPNRPAELSQSEELLLRNQNPVEEARQLLKEEGTENQSMMIIFSAMEAKNDTRRY